MRSSTLTLLLAASLLAFSNTVTAKEPDTIDKISSFFKKLHKSIQESSSKNQAKKSSNKTTQKKQTTKAKTKVSKKKKKAAKPVAKKQTKQSKPKAVASKKAVPAAVATTAAAATAATANAPESEEEKIKPAMVSSMTPDELVEFEQQPRHIQELIRSALDLTQQNLTYTFGSSNPKNGGMDCSGAIQYLLKDNGFRGVPRTANSMFNWMDKRNTLIPASEISKIKAPELDLLRPGDLLFWSGTYETDREITHVMMYLGTHKKTKRPVMFGASDGRYYKGQRRRGVSVFDFRLPKPERKSKFQGYGPIPGTVVTAKAGA